MAARDVRWARSCRTIRKHRSVVLRLRLASRCWSEPTRRWISVILISGPSRWSLGALPGRLAYSVAGPSVACLRTLPMLSRRTRSAVWS